MGFFSRRNKQPAPPPQTIVYVQQTYNGSPQEAAPHGTYHRQNWTPPSSQESTLIPGTGLRAPAHDPISSYQRPGAFTFQANQHWNSQQQQTPSWQDNLSPGNRTAPGCPTCQSRATRQIVGKNNKNGNAGRPYYNCAPCKAFVRWDD